MMPKVVNLVGRRFGRLLVISEAEKRNGRKQYQCRCDCGNEKTITSAGLLHGKTRSCGCLRVEKTRSRNTKRFSESSRRNQTMYRRYHSMLQRCENPANPNWKNYGARGIHVCDRWRASYDAFLQDMGSPPFDGYTIERIDNDSGYSPENCVWASRKTQLRNQRRSIIIEIDGVKLHAKDWADKTGCCYETITKHYREGGIEQATAFVAEYVPWRW